MPMVVSRQSFFSLAEKLAAFHNRTQLCVGNVDISIFTAYIYVLGSDIKYPDLLHRGGGARKCFRKDPLCQSLFLHSVYFMIFGGFIPKRFTIVSPRKPRGL